MKVIIYGIGKMYLQFFHDFAFVKKAIIEKKMKIMGITDGNQDTWGTEITFYGEKFIVQSINEFENKDIDRIIVTTKLYFHEISDELIKNNYMENQIILVDHLFEKYLDEIFHIKLFEKKEGIEIGGPTELFYSIYKKCSKCDNVNFSSNTIWWENETGDFRYKGQILGKVWINEATNMNQIGSENYDFILSSNNLEHIANPLKALSEFFRILKNEGIVLVIVPKKDKIFDHNRDYTEFDHLLQDYKDNIGEDDLSHLPEIIEKHDYDMDIPCGGKTKFIERAKKNIENRCLHHHVFDEECLRKAFAFVELEVVDFGIVKDNWMIIGKKGMKR